MRAACLVVALCAACAALAAGIGGVAEVGAACAQAPPPVPFPTIGPVDPSCGSVPDTDNDGVFDYEDNCQGYYNPSQLDTDHDSGEPPYQPINVQQRDPKTGGDTCDTDDDGDGVSDVDDNCPKVANKDQADSDGDGKGNVCDPQPTAPEAARGASASPAGATQTASRGALKLSVLRLARRQRLAELRAGLAVPVRCSDACAITGELRAGRGVLGRGRAIMEQGGMTFVFVRLSQTAMRRVSRAGTERATLRLTFGGVAGGAHSTLSRKLVLQR